MTPIQAMAAAIAEYTDQRMPRSGDVITCEGIARAALDSLASNISEGMVEASTDAFAQYCRYETDWQGVIEAAIKAACDDAMLQRAKEEG